MRKGPINTIPYRLRRCGFISSISGNSNFYFHVNGDKLSRKDGIYGLGWYIVDINGNSIHYSCLKKLIVKWIETSDRYRRDL